MAYMTDLANLKALCVAATPGDLDTVPSPPSEYGGKSSVVHTCPACNGSGELEGVDYCNFDGAAIGVHFYGIGPEFLNYEAFFRAANPAAILDLIERVERAEGGREADRQASHGIINERDKWIVELVRERAALIDLVREGMEEAIPDALIFGMHTDASTWTKAKKSFQAWVARSKAALPNPPTSEGGE